MALQLWSFVMRASVLLALCAACARGAAPAEEQMTVKLFINTKKSQVPSLDSDAKPAWSASWRGAIVPHHLAARSTVVVPTALDAKGKLESQWAHLITTFRSGAAEKEIMVANETWPLSERWWVRLANGSKKMQLFHQPRLRMVQVMELVEADDETEDFVGRHGAVRALWGGLIDRAVAKTRRALAPAVDAASREARCVAEGEGDERAEGGGVSVEEAWRLLHLNKPTHDTFWDLEADLIGLDQNATSLTFDVSVVKLSSFRMGLLRATDDAFAMLGITEDQLDQVKDIWRTIFSRGTLYFYGFGIVGFSSLALPTLVTFFQFRLWANIDMTRENSDALADISILSIVLRLLFDLSEAILPIMLSVAYLVYPPLWHFHPPCNTIALALGAEYASNDVYYQRRREAGGEIPLSQHAAATAAAEEAAAAATADPGGVAGLAGLQMIDYGGGRDEARSFGIMCLAVVITLWKLHKSKVRVQVKVLLVRTCRGCGCVLPRLSVRFKAHSSFHRWSRVPFATRRRRKKKKGTEEAVVEEEEEEVLAPPPASGDAMFCRVFAATLIACSAFTSMLLYASVWHIGMLIDGIAEVLPTLRITLFAVPQLYATHRSGRMSWDRARLVFVQAALVTAECMLFVFAWQIVVDLDTPYAKRGLDEELTGLGSSWLLVRWFHANALGVWTQADVLRVLRLHARRGVTFLLCAAIPLSQAVWLYIYQRRCSRAKA